MYDVQDEHLSKGVTESQIKKAAYHLRFFLVWVVFTSFYNIVTYHQFFNYQSTNYNIWFFVNSSINIFAWFITQQFIDSKKISLFNLDAWCQLVCLICGTSLGIGVLIINHYLIVENSQITGIHVLLSSLMSSSIYIIGIVYLTQRLRYFLFMFIPTTIPVLLAKTFFHDNVPDVYNFIFYSWSIVVLISAILTHKIHRHLNRLNIHNQFYLKQSKKHLNESEVLQSQLQLEIAKSKNIENELQLNNQLLEQKVKERTYDINRINESLQNHQANLDFAHETAGIHSWLWNIDKRTIELSGKKSEVKVIQYDNKDQIDVLIHPDDKPTYNRLMRQHLRGYSDRFEASYRVFHDEKWHWIKDIGKVIARDPETRLPLRMVGIHQDIEQEKNDQDQLKLASIVFNQAAQGIFVLDTSLCFLDANPYFCELIDIPRDQLIARHMFDITINTHFEISKVHSEISQKVLNTGSFNAEVSDEFISGKSLTVWLHINAVYDDKNRIINYVGAITDLTERRQHEERLAYLENYDLLTDLPNRVYFNLQMHQYLLNKTKPLNHFAVLRLNIDRFRNFNEFLTHQAGDELLKKISKRLKKTCPDAVLIAYLNNDDFAIIYNLSHPRNPIQQKIDEIIAVCSRPFRIYGHEHAVTVSLGVAIYPDHGRQIGSLNSHAEIALLEAKKLGGNTAHYYKNKSNTIQGSDLQLEIDLKNAVKNNKLQVYYQAKVDSEMMKTVGFEALIRWNHPQHGLIMPDRFLAIAEETSMISEIGEFVFFEACKQIKQWQDQGLSNIQISVNIVAQQIHRGLLLNQIDEALAHYEIDPKFLELELTESSLLDKSESVVELLQQIKDRNIKIALDDFGTGYSSLAYLAAYPIDILKIDRAFITKIGSTKDDAIVNAIIAMGKAMGMKLVAEGVENLEQIKYLKQQGCDYFQGYYFSRPLNAEDCTEFLIQEKLIQ